MSDYDQLNVSSCVTTQNQKEIIRHTAPRTQSSTRGKMSFTVSGTVCLWFQCHIQKVIYRSCVTNTEWLACVCTGALQWESLKDRGVHPMDSVHRPSTHILASKIIRPLLFISLWFRVLWEHSLKDRLVMGQQSIQGCKGHYKHFGTRPPSSMNSCFIFAPLRDPDRTTTQERPYH